MICVNIGLVLGKRQLAVITGPVLLIRQVQSHLFGKDLPSVVREVAAVRLGNFCSYCYKIKIAFIVIA